MHSAYILYIILVHVHIKLYVWFIYVLLYYYNSNHGTIMTQKGPRTHGYRDAGLTYLAHLQCTPVSSSG